MLAHGHERVRVLLGRLLACREATHMRVGGCEAAHVEGTPLRILLDGVLFDWVDDWRHLKVLLFAEAEDLSIHRYVHFDLFCGLDTWE